MKLTKKILKSKTFQLFICWMAHIYVWLVYLTSRWHVIGQQHIDSMTNSHKPFIVAFWHGRLLMIPPFAPSGVKMNVLISTHNDGELIAKVMEHFKFTMIRGSSKRDALSAFKNVINALKAGDAVVITPDGPQGPRMRLGGNIIKIAQMTSVPIIPMVYSIANGRTLRSWDSFMIAKPFGKGAVIYGEPLHVDKSLDEEGLKAAGAELEKRLNDITMQADKLVGLKPVQPAEKAI